MCSIDGYVDETPKKVGETLNAGAYAKNDDGTPITTTVYLKGYNPATSAWKTFAQTIPNPTNAWAGMPMITFTDEHVGTWTMSFDATDKNGNGCGAGPWVLTINPTSITMTLQSDKMSITSGDTVSFYGTYKPNSDINIFIEGTIKTHITSVKTNSLGNYNVSAKLESSSYIRLQIGACSDGSIGIECNLLSPDKSNYVYIDIYPQSTTPPLATHKFVISLSPLSWADYTGLNNYLPSITSIFANLVTGYGIFGWNILETQLEGNDLVIYIQDTSVSLVSTKIQTLPVPAVIGGMSLTAIVTAALTFGFLVIAWKYENILEAKVEVQKEITDIAKTNLDILDEKYKNGEITYQQYIDALALINKTIEEGKEAGSAGICEDLLGLTSDECTYLKYGALALGGLIIIKMVSDSIPKSK